MKEMDSRCPQDHQPSKTSKPTKEQKNSNSHKSKSQKQKIQALWRSNSTESSKKA